MSETLANLLHETRSFPPPPELVSQANVTANAYAAAGADRLAFWERQADRLHWHQRWDEVLDWTNPPFAKWFVGGQLNVAYNCLGRHLEAGNGDRVAILAARMPANPRRCARSGSTRVRTCSNSASYARDVIRSEVSGPPFV